MTQQTDSIQIADSNAPQAVELRIGDGDKQSGEGLFFAQVGCRGHVGRFQLAEPIAIRRGDRTVCRTARGLELGTVMGTAAHAAGRDSADGRILRKMTAEDELLWGHLQRLGQEALAMCCDWLQANELDAILLDVEPLLDGRTLYFHFLSSVDGAVQDYLDELVAIYEERVRASKFAQLLEHGCGPGCGTEKAKNGCGSGGGCAICKVVGSCSPRGTK